jgi:N-acetyldiaminopimelate deacetylase
MESMEKVKTRIESLARGIEAGFDCEASIDYGSNYCQVYNDPALTREFMEWARAESGLEVIECKEAMTGEDFGYFLSQIPGFLFWLGVDTPFGLHHARIEPNEQAMEIGVNLITNYISWFSKHTNVQKAPVS